MTYSSNQARVQVPWVKVTIGGYTLVFMIENQKVSQSEKAIYTKAFDVQYPNYINNLKITKINGQINKYNLVYLSY